MQNHFLQNSVLFSVRIDFFHICTIKKTSSCPWPLTTSVFTIWSQNVLLTFNTSIQNPSWKSAALLEIRIWSFPAIGCKHTKSQSVHSDHTSSVFSLLVTFASAGETFTRLLHKTRWHINIHLYLSVLKGSRLKGDDKNRCSTVCFGIRFPSESFQSFLSQDKETPDEWLVQSLSLLQE